MTTPVSAHQVLQVAVAHRHRPVSATAAAKASLPARTVRPPRGFGRVRLSVCLSVYTLVSAAAAAAAGESARRRTRANLIASASSTGRRRRQRNTT